MGKFATVDEYVATIEGPLRDVLDKVRPLVDAELADANSAVWHQAPTWSLGAAPGKGPVCFLRAFTSYVTFCFWRASELTDPSGRLEVGGRGMGSVKLRSVDEVDTELFTDWLRQARALELAALGKS